MWIFSDLDQGAKIYLRMAKFASLSMEYAEREEVAISSKGNRDFDLILFRQLMRLAEKCGSLNTVRLCCFDTCCNSGTLQSMKQIDTPIGSTISKKRDKSKSCRVIHSCHYEERKI